MQRNQKGRFCRKVTEGFKGYFFKANRIFCKAAIAGCRAKYYKLGATYNKRKGIKPKPCTDTGYHFCKDPAEVWNYYPPFKLSVYTKVTLPKTFIMGGAEKSSPMDTFFNLMNVQKAEQLNKAVK